MRECECGTQASYFKYQTLNIIPNIPNWENVSMRETCHIVKAWCFMWRVDSISFLAFAFNVHLSLYHLFIIIIFFGSSSPLENGECLEYIRLDTHLVFLFWPWIHTQKDTQNFNTHDAQCISIWSLFVILFLVEWSTLCGACLLFGMSNGKWSLWYNLLVSIQIQFQIIDSFHIMWKIAYRFHCWIADDWCACEWNKSKSSN